MQHYVFKLFFSHLPCPEKNQGEISVFRASWLGVKWLDSACIALYTPLMPKRRTTQKDAPTEEEMADELAGNRQAALLALRDLRIAMRHVAGNEPLHLAYAAETGAKGNNASKWAKKASAQYWLEAVQLAKEATDEAVAAAVEGSQLLILADPEASHRDKTAAAGLLAKMRGLDRVKVEVVKSEEDMLFEQMLKQCKVKQFGLPDDAIDV